MINAGAKTPVPENEIAEAAKGHKAQQKIGGGDSVAGLGPLATQWVAITPPIRRDEHPVMNTPPWASEEDVPL